MKIGIATITNGANYGNKLQNYAMFQIVRNLGHDAENIRKSCDNIPSLKIKFQRFIIKKLKIRNYAKVKREDIFAHFNKEYLKTGQYQYNNADFNHNDYDMIICGSDQIWNVNYQMVYRQMDCFFATFVPENKRCAFSASIGVDEITEEHKQTFIDCVNGIKYISVRENQGATIIKNLTGREVPVTLDPTLMLTTDQWLRIAQKPKYIKRQKFILTYFLGDYNEQIKNYVNAIANVMGCQVINLQDLYVCGDAVINEKWFTTSPNEFIWLVANCQAMITDSFHGCVFSTIFKKPFRWFSRSGGFSKNMNSRLETLFDKLQLGDWCIGDVNEPVENIFNCDYSSVDENLAKEQEFAYDYLKDALK